MIPTTSRMRPGALAIVAAGLLGAAGCGPPTPPTPGPAGTTVVVSTTTTAAPRPDSGALPPHEPGPFRFEDVAGRAGVDFVNESGTTAEKHFPTANGCGVAVLDYDGDGRMDLYFANACRLPLGSHDSSPNRLYRNRGDGTFEDATEASGLGHRGFTHGILVADLDNDGDPDVVLCTYGPNALYLNNGDGTFTDASAASGLDRPDWSTGGAALDYDGDGDLDLYLANYGEWSLPEDDRYCGDEARGVRLYCSPRTVRTGRHALWRNEGVVDGVPRFRDVTEAAGIARDDGHGFAAVAADLDEDGKVDLYVANDMGPNFLFRNRGDGTFEDATLTSGAAFDEGGQALSSMGVDAEDIDGDGLPELFVSNNFDEFNTLYRNLGGGGFLDQTTSYGLAEGSRPLVGWGCGLVDLDNDGWPDGVVANGHIDDNRGWIEPGTLYEQPPLLYRNAEGRRFVLANRGAGPYFESRHVGRGMAFGDLDDDGRLDLVINHKDGPPAVLLNRTPTENRWLRLKLVGRASNRDAIGARVVLRYGGRTVVRQRKGGSGLESAHDPRLLIGVGTAERVESIGVRWPSGALTTLSDVETNRDIEVVEP